MCLPTLTSSSAESCLWRTLLLVQTLPMLMPCSQQQVPESNMLLHTTPCRGATGPDRTHWHPTAEQTGMPG
jgi:hypothetical protein